MSIIAVPSMSPDALRQSMIPRLSGDETYASAVSISPKRAWADPHVGDSHLGGVSSSLLDNPNEQVSRMMSEQRRKELLQQLERQREERRLKAQETGTSFEDDFSYARSYKQYGMSSAAQPGAESLKQSAQQQREHVLKMLEARRAQRQGEDGFELRTSMAEPSDATINGVISPADSNEGSDSYKYGDRVAGYERQKSQGSSTVVTNSVSTDSFVHRRSQRPMSAPVRGCEECDDARNGL